MGYGFVSTVCHVVHSRVPCGRPRYSSPVITGRTRLVGLLGDPVAGSLSPRMHNAAFAALALDWAYVPLPVATARLADAVRGLQAVGFAGANVTIPHKRAAVDLCDELSRTAERAGSVNTLVFRDGRVLGDSTDGEAVTSAIDADGRRALVLGAGGAAQAVVAALWASGAADVVVAQRRAPGWPPSGEGLDVLVNATPVRDEVLVAPQHGQQVVDLAYREDGEPTALVAAARAAGCDQVVDGLEVLVRQGAASFERWTGLPAPVDVMRAALGSRA
jgi:shikimate dehydrogenase